MTSDRARSDPDDALIKGALLAAVETARADLHDPGRHRDVPGPIARVAGFRSLSKAALSQVRGALEDQPAFRQRVLSHAGDDELDEPSRLFLARPEGWEDALPRATPQIDGDEVAGAGERSADRRLRAAEARSRRAEAAKREADDLIQTLTAEVERERERVAEVQRRLAATELELVRAREALDDLGVRLRRAEGKRAEEAHRVEQVAAARDLLRAERDELRRRLDAAERAADRVTPPPGPAGRAGDPAVAEAIDGAARAAAALAEQLAQAARHLVDRSSERDVADAGPAPGVSTSRPDRQRRRPLALPPGILDDSIEAAAHLVRSPGVLLLVDGYNASLRRWPHLPIDQQRDRLVAALAELAARCGPAVHVVFDGVVASSRTASGGARGIAVSFTEDGMEADDAILDAIADHTRGGGVLVASDDRRVRDGARDLGANVLSLDQLFAVLRRER